MAENGASEASWASGWYVRRRHVYETQVARQDGSVPAICDPYTGVYPNGYGDGRYAVPMADSPEVLALPACKKCLRKIGVTAERISLYLVQRLKRNRYGGGKGFDAIFDLDYMGSSEFEWGAIPKALKEMRSTPLARAEADVTHQGVSRRVHLIAPAQGVQARVDALRVWLGEKNPRGKERTYFPENMVDSANEWHREVVAWWAIDSCFAWTLDEAVADDLWRAITMAASADEQPS